MANVTNTTVLPPAVREYYDRLLLMTAFPELIHTKFAQKRTLPEKMGDTVVFRRYNRMSTVPVPLVDGITPPGATLSHTDLKTRVDFYGNFVVLTDQVELTVEDRVLNESSKLLAQNLAQTMDEVTRDVLASTSSVALCSNGVNGNTPTELTKEDIDNAIQTLLGNDAKMMTDEIEGTDAFGTSPVRKAFWVFSDTALIDDLESVANFVSVANYPPNKRALDAEWGATGNARWLVTSVGSVSSASPAVYNNMIVGQEAYGVVHLGSETGEFYVEPLGSGGSTDPLHQRGSVGWKHPFAARILNDNFMINLMCTHT
ncbi:MAG: N4-gp56 family major capsid protein [Nitrosopumilaceae archaeon]|nr:N4-gp56 family major capsid protein [Nitrosopumilaceae archaeon]